MQPFISFFYINDTNVKVSLWPGYRFQLDLGSERITCQLFLISVKISKNMLGTRCIYLRSKITYDFKRSSVQKH